MKNSRGLTLVGNFFPAESQAVIIMAHGFTSDKSATGRFDRLAKSFNASGYNVLAFDFGGCGESDDDILVLEHQLEDLKTAIAFVWSKGLRTIGLYGHSLGGLICLKSYSEVVRTMVLSGALTDRISYDWSQYYPQEQLLSLQQDGYLTTVDRTGKTRRISQQMLDAFEQIEQRELVKNVGCPVLLIHGNNDEEEQLLLERSRRAVNLLPSDSRLEVIDGADHSFSDHIDKVERLANGWFIQHLPIQRS